MRTIRDERRRHSPRDHLLLKASLGLGLGFLGGFFLGELLGQVTGDRVRRLARAGRARMAPAAPDPVRAIRDALAGDPVLEAAALDVRRVGTRGVEIHGWVDRRQDRTRLHRLATGAAPDRAVVNAVRVHGEDDVQPPTLTTTSLPA